MSSIRLKKGTQPTTPPTDRMTIWYDTVTDKPKYVKADGNAYEFGFTSHLSLSDIGTNSHAQIDTHIASTSNPHSVTKTQVGLGSVADALQLVAANNLSDLTSASTARTNLGVAIGTNVQAFDATLSALAAYNTNGILTQTAADTFVGRTMTGGTGVTVTNGDGVAGNPTFAIGQPVATTDTVQFLRVGLGSAQSDSIILNMRAPGTLTGTTQYSIFSDFTLSSAATSGGVGVYSRVRTSAATYTASNLMSFFAESPLLGAGSTITNSYGFYAEPQTVGNNRFGLHLNNAAASNVWNVYCATDAANYMLGNLQLGTTTTGLAQFISSTTSASKIAGIFRGAASQTANLTEWRNSSGAVGAFITPTGQFSNGGGAITNGAFITSEVTTTTNVATTVAKFSTFVSNATDRTSQAFGTLNYLTLNTDVNHSNTHIGYYMDAGSNTLGPGSGKTVNGLWVSFNRLFWQSAGTLTEGVCYYASRSITSGTVTNGYMYRCSSWGSGVTNKWGIYIEGADSYNYLAGDVLIGTTTRDLAELAVVSNSATKKIAVFRAAASATANLTEWQNSSATVLTALNSSGQFSTFAGFADAVDIAVGTTTGTKIGTSTSQKIGFFNATPVVQQTVTGSRGGNAALADLLTKLAALGLIVDSTTA